MSFGALTARGADGARKFTFGIEGTPIYSNERGYGFEAGPRLNAVAGADGYVTAAEPFYFSVAVPEGNYKVTVTLGNARGESSTTVKAELRRLMLEEVQTTAKEFRHGALLSMSASRTIRAAPRLKGARESALKRGPDENSRWSSTESVPVYARWKLKGLTFRRFSFWRFDGRVR
jgi:hypothetical protein